MRCKLQFVTGQYAPVLKIWVMTARLLLITAMLTAFSMPLFLSDSSVLAQTDDAAVTTGEIDADEVDDRTEDDKIADAAAEEEEEYAESKDMAAPLILLLLLLLILMLHGMPLFGALGGLALVMRYHAVGPKGLLINFVEPFSNLSGSELLLPIPLFTLVGYILANSKAPSRIVMVFRYALQKILSSCQFLVNHNVTPFFFPLLFIPIVKRGLIRYVEILAAASFGILALIVSAVFTPLTGASGVTLWFTRN